MAADRAPTRYARLIEHIFAKKFRPGDESVEFERDDIRHAARDLSIKLPKNLGDVVYTMRYRAALPPGVASKAPKGKVWVIRPAGHSRYAFVAVTTAHIEPHQALAEVRIPDATPGLLARYALSDEQALLAVLRYNRLLDIFTGVTTYSLQSHLRTNVPGMGQLETDEVYVGVDKVGAHYVFPVQAKGGRDKISIVQIEQDIAMCAMKFPGTICRPVAAQFMDDDLVALFELAEDSKRGVVVAAERHYRLVASDEITDEDLDLYRQEAMRR